MKQAERLIEALFETTGHVIVQYPTTDLGRFRLWSRNQSTIPFRELERFVVLVESELW